MSWMHIVRVYEDDIGLENLHPALRKLNKIKEEHINLSPRHRIRLQLAAQVNKFNVSVIHMYLSMFSHPVIIDKNNIFSCSHCSSSIFVLISYSLDTQEE